MRNRFRAVAIMILSLITIQGAYASKERRDLKKMCKEQRSLCVEQGTSKAECRDLWKQCRQENHVTFADDLAYLQEQIDLALKKAVASVELTLGQNEEVGEFLDITIRSPHFSKLPAFSYDPPGYSSSIAMLATTSGTSELHLVLATSDLENKGVGGALQITQGESFPTFLDSRSFESLWGVNFDMGQIQDTQIYFDGDEKIVVSFIPVPAIGDMLERMNEFKNTVPVIKDLIPDIKSLPVALKYQGDKIGKFYLLGNNNSGERAGLLFLIDHAKAMEAVKK